MPPLPLRWILLYAAFVFSAAALLQRSSAHGLSRLDTVDALVERGNFAIDDAPYDTVDKVYIVGHYYAHQPPAQAVVGALVYWPLRLFGLRLGPGRVAAFALVTWAVNGLVTLLGLICFYRALARNTVAEPWRLPVTYSLACATLLLPFATTMNGHSFSAALLAAGVWCYVTHRYPSAGLAFGAAAAADHAMAVFFVLFALVLALRNRPSAIRFLLSGLPPLLLTATYYYAIGGKLTPFAARPELFAYPGSVWSYDGDIYHRLTGAAWNSGAFALRYGAELLIGPQGFLIYNPLAWLALYGVVQTVRRRGPWGREAAAVLVGSCAVIAYYSLVSVNHSGWTYSIRWFVPLLPLWWYFGAPVVNGFGVRAKRAAGALCALGVFYSLAGVLNPWPSPFLGYATPVANIVEELHRPHFGHYLFPTEKP